MRLTSPAAFITLLERHRVTHTFLPPTLVMRGYHRDPAATAATSARGWHHTGDIGYLDDENYLFIVDRAKDMVITGGFNVYSKTGLRTMLTTLKSNP